MNVAYVRVSTAEQNEARQVEQLRDYGIDKWFIEKISGKDVNRPAFQSMMEFVREGDCVYVLDWSRLSRSVTDLLTTIETLDRKNVKLISIKENFNEVFIGDNFSFFNSICFHAITNEISF